MMLLDIDYHEEEEEEVAKMAIKTEDLARGG